MTITKQRVEEIISRIEMYGHGAGYTADEVYALAVLALNLSNIANLKRYELDMDGCDSFGQDCGADMTEDPDGDYVLFDDVVKLFEFDTFESPARETPVNKIDYQALREAAQLATQGEWVAFISSGTGTYAVHTPGDKRCEDVIKWTGFDGQNNAENNARYIAAFNPEVVQALLDELERNQQYIKRRDQENEDIALTVGKLRVELEEVKQHAEELSETNAVRNQWRPDICPITGRAFFMWIEHPTLGNVPTYGGPLDSYTIPTKDGDGEFSCERYDHDFGGWVESECLGLYLIDDREQCRVYELEERVKELDAREITLPERSSMLHRTDFHDDYQTVMAYKVSEVIAAIRAVWDSALIAKPYVLMADNIIPAPKRRHTGIAAARRAAKKRRRAKR